MILCESCGCCQEHCQCKASGEYRPNYISKGKCWVCDDEEEEDDEDGDE